MQVGKWNFDAIAAMQAHPNILRSQGGGTVGEFRDSSFPLWIRGTIVHMGVSKNRGTPKWMVYNGKPF